MADPRGSSRPPRTCPQDQTRPRAGSASHRLHRALLPATQAPGPCAAPAPPSPVPSQLAPALQGGFQMLRGRPGGGGRGLRTWASLPAGTVIDHRRRPQTIDHRRGDRSSSVRGQSPRGCPVPPHVSMAATRKHRPGVRACARPPLCPAEASSWEGGADTVLGPSVRGGEKGGRPAGVPRPSRGTPWREGLSVSRGTGLQGGLYFNWLVWILGIMAQKE